MGDQISRDTEMCSIALSTKCTEINGKIYIYFLEFRLVVCVLMFEPFNPLAYQFFTQKMVSRSIYNLKIDTIYMCDIPFDRSFLQLSNGIRHVMPSTNTKPELTAKASMSQPVSQPAVYANGLSYFSLGFVTSKAPTCNTGTIRSGK
jgi:hypothetical protein